MATRDKAKVEQRRIELERQFKEVYDGLTCSPYGEKELWNQYADTERRLRYVRTVLAELEDRKQQEDQQWQKEWMERRPSICHAAGRDMVMEGRSQIESWFEDAGLTWLIAELDYIEEKVDEHFDGDSDEPRTI